MPTQSFPQHLQGEAAVPETEDEFTVDFSSERAGEVAVELGFTPDMLEGMTGSGRDGAITVSDLRDWVKED